MGKLTARQNIFVSEYLIGLNAKQAAIKAGYSEKTAEVQGYQLLQKPLVQEKIQEAMRDREKRTQVTQDKVINELVKIAFTDGSDFARLTTTVVSKKVWSEKHQDFVEAAVEEQHIQFYDTDSLTKETRAAISSIKKTRHGLAVESYDKLKALELLMRHLGMIKDKLEVVTNPFENLTEADLRKLVGDAS